MGCADRAKAVRRTKPRKRQRTRKALRSGESSGSAWSHSTTFLGTEGVRSVAQTEFHGKVFFVVFEAGLVAVILHDEAMSVAQVEVETNENAGDAKEAA